MAFTRAPHHTLVIKGTKLLPKRMIGVWLSSERTPYTTSARPAAMGASSFEKSDGSYSKSASWITITSPLAPHDISTRDSGDYPHESPHFRGDSYWPGASTIRCV